MSELEACGHSTSFPSVGVRIFSHSSMRGILCFSEKRDVAVVRVSGSQFSKAGEMSATLETQSSPSAVICTIGLRAC